MEKIYQSYYSIQSHKKVICVMLNYGAPNPDTPVPMLFDKPMEAALVSGQPLQLAENQTFINEEVELGVRIGMTGKNIHPDEYLKYISHYFLAIDFANRNLM